jgi:hypothetical protein
MSRRRLIPALATIEITPSVKLWLLRVLVESDGYAPA